MSDFPLAACSETPASTLFGGLVSSFVLHMACVFRLAASMLTIPQIGMDYQVESSQDLGSTPRQVQQASIHPNPEQNEARQGKVGRKVVKVDGDPERA
jgi:hypothetical protein